MNKIDEIKERLSKATPGPWVSMDECGIYNDNVITIHNDSLTPVAAPPEAPEGDNWHADSDFIAYAPEDMAHLLTEVERYKAVVGVAKRLLDGLHDEPDWEGFGPTNVVRYDDVVSLKTALAEMEAEE